jgi:hypothetical protein
VRSTFTEVLVCRCSICAMKGFLHLIVAAEDFALEAGEDALACYQFGTRTARHLFCATCGICSYYVPRSHPDGYSVNLRCVEGVDWERVRRVPFAWGIDRPDVPPT